MKICHKCQCELEDIAKFCLNCGEKFEDAVAVPADSSINKTPKKMPVWLSKFLGFFPVAGRFLKKHFLKLPIKARIILVAAVFLLIFIPCVAGCGKDYRKVVKQYEKLLNQECDDYTEYLPIFFPSDACDVIDDTYSCIDDISDDYADAVDELLEDTFNNYYDEVYDDYGEYKIHIFIKKASRISSRDLKKIQNHIDDLYEDINALSLDEAAFKTYLASIGANEKYARDLEKLYKRYVKILKHMNIEKGYTLRLIVSIKGEDDMDEELVKKVHVLRINGEWVLSTESFMDEFPEFANPFTNLSNDAYDMINSLKNHTRSSRAPWFEACRDWILPKEQQLPDFAPLAEEEDATDVVLKRMLQRNRSPKLNCR